MLGNYWFGDGANAVRKLVALHDGDHDLRVFTKFDTVYIFSHV
jgi:hypothetical protein